MPSLGTPKISVVVPVYKVETYLDTCVTSLVNQTFTDLEIVLVDDGSPDRSGELCDQWAKKDSRIRVIHKENGGLSDARNAGIQAARGDYIGLVDSDDFVDTDMYELLYTNLQKEQADVSVCTIYSCYKDVTNTFGNGSYHVMNGREMIGYSMDGTKAVISACPKLYRKQLLLDTPFTKGRLYEDALLFCELFSKVDRVVVEEKPKYYYMHHESTITTASYKGAKKDYIYAYETNLRIVQSCCPQYEPVAFYRLLRAHYELLDMALLADNDDARTDKPMFEKFLRRHYGRLMTCRYIGLRRKLAVTLVLLSETLYKQLLLKKQTNSLI